MAPDWLLLVLAPELLLLFLVESFTVSVFYEPSKAKKYWGSVKCSNATSGRGLLAFRMVVTWILSSQVTARLCPILCGTGTLECVQIRPRLALLGTVC